MSLRSFAHLVLALSLAVLPWQGVGASWCAGVLASDLCGSPSGMAEVQIRAAEPATLPPSRVRTEPAAAVRAASPADAWGVMGVASEVGRERVELSGLGRGQRQAVAATATPIFLRNCAFLC